MARNTNASRREWLGCSSASGELHPLLPIIYMTGDSLDQWTAPGVPGSLVLQKPFDGLRRRSSILASPWTELPVRKAGAAPRQPWDVSYIVATTVETERLGNRRRPGVDYCLSSSARSRFACSLSNLPKSVMMLTRTLPVQPKVNKPDIAMIGPSRRHRSGRLTLPSPSVV